MKITKNAQIVSATLGGFDEGYTMLTYYIRLLFDDGKGVVYGDRNLGGKDQPSLAAYDILKLLEITDSKNWCDLKGKYVRVEYVSKNGYDIQSIRLGHIVKDIWHDYRDFY